MSINSEGLKQVEQEEQILNATLTSLKQQISRSHQKLNIEAQRARELTSELVAANRAEDKAMLASDEAVSHGIKDQKIEELEGLSKIILQPYFARLIVEEEVQGKLKELEYKIGFTANPDCRIIDWRKAPISKLYYEYKEGDDYSEVILGKEREGQVKLRNTVDIKKSVLLKVSCRHGTFVKNGGNWTQTTSNSKVARSKDANGLQNILALITPQQFRTITEDARTPILIQGIAGSGKTTVALHRLAWLLHANNSDLQADQTAVIVLSKTLKRYISGTLPSIDVHGVAVFTFSEWAAISLQKVCPHLLSPSKQLLRPTASPSASQTRTFQSLSVLRVVEEYAANYAKASSKPQPEEVIFEALSNTLKILRFDETHLLDANLIKSCQQRLVENIQNHVVDYCCDALIIRAAQILNANLCLPSGLISRYGHIVADEVQDMSVAELACILNAVKSSHNLTLVGDVSQQTNEAGFPGWEKLKHGCSDTKTIPQYISLAVSHRSTLPIMRLADYIQQRQLVTEGREGRIPIWFKCKGEESGIKAVIDWLNKALERYPNSLTAVICSDSEQAKFAYKMLKNSFGSGLRLGNESDFSFEEGIVVTDCIQVKGLEFINVLLWNPDSQAYPNTSQARNLLYVAVSRAEENLCLVTWGSSSACLPHFGSKLFRNFDLREEEVQEEKRDPLELR